MCCKLKDAKVKSMSNFFKVKFYYIFLVLKINPHFCRDFAVLLSPSDPVNKLSGSRSFNPKQESPFFLMFWRIQGPRYGNILKTNGAFDSHLCAWRRHQEVSVSVSSCSITHCTNRTPSGVKRRKTGLAKRLHLA